MLTFVDLFAGIGGLRLGIERVFRDSKCILTSEIDKFAQETYRCNFDCEQMLGDIRNISDESIPAHDLLLAGFPCQPFSQAGLKKGFEDDRGNLFFEIVRFLSLKKPSCFLLENVKQLKGHAKGKTLSVILQALEEIGYANTSYSVLSSKDFGVPQRRERLYLIGFRDENVTFSFPHPLNVETSVHSILENNIDAKYTLSDRLWNGHKRRKERNKQEGKGFGFSLFDASSSYTNTLSARYYKDGSEILISQGSALNPRKLTPREAARLQGFPDTFKIPVSDNQAYRQFGNSVSVPVIEAIAQEIKKSMTHSQKS